jgi:hypothetical protein
MHRLISSHFCNQENLMKLSSLLALSTLAASPAFAQETRQLDSHEHGVGQLDIAIDGSQVAMELHAPGADIVGFEYGAQSDEDIAKVDAALLVLAQPLDLFVVPDAAQCSVVDARAELEAEDDHEDGDEDHGEEGHDDHEEDGHDDHEGEDHEEDGHDDHEGEDHVEDAGHTEFHAEYLLECGDITALSEISFAYFTAFPNALEVEVQVISDQGATAFEVERDAPMLDLSNLN